MMTRVQSGASTASILTSFFLSHPDIIHSYRLLVGVVNVWPNCIWIFNMFIRALHYFCQPSTVCSKHVECNTLRYRLRSLNGMGIPFEEETCSYNRFHWEWEYNLNRPCLLFLINDFKLLIPWKNRCNYRKNNLTPIFKIAYSASAQNNLTENQGFSWCQLCRHR